MLVVTADEAGLMIHPYIADGTRLYLSILAIAKNKNNIAGAKKKIKINDAGIFLFHPVNFNINRNPAGTTNRKEVSEILKKSTADFPDRLKCISPSVNCHIPRRRTKTKKIILVVFLGKAMKTNKHIPKLIRAGIKKRRISFQLL